MKSVRIDEITYEKIVRHAKENSRTITATIGILVSQALNPVKQINNINGPMEAVTPARGTVFDDTTCFTTVDEALEFYGTHDKPIHREGDDKTIGVCELVEYSSELMSLRRQVAELDEEANKDGSDWQKLAIEAQEARGKISAIMEKVDNFIDNYQGLTS